MTRSNRKLTQFAVDKMRQALIHGPETFVDAVAGNTAVELKERSHSNKPSHELIVNLFDKEILRVFFGPGNDRAVTGVMISAGGFYDKKGRPSRTTRERLNGLLDALGSTGSIPEGVRVFFRDDGACCLGKGDSYKSLDSENSSSFILSCSTELLFGKTSQR